MLTKTNKSEERYRQIHDGRIRNAVGRLLILLFQIKFFDSAAKMNSRFYTMDEVEADESGVKRKVLLDEVSAWKLGEFIQRGCTPRQNVFVLTLIIGQERLRTLLADIPSRSVTHVDTLMKLIFVKHITRLARDKLENAGETTVDINPELAVCLIDYITFIEDNLQSEYMASPTNSGGKSSLLESVLEPLTACYSGQV